MLVSTAFSARGAELTRTQEVPGIAPSNHGDVQKSLQAWLARCTHHRLRDIEIWQTIDGVEIIATSATYYVVQLALVAVSDFIAECTEVSSARLLIHVNGQPLKLCVTNGAEHQSNRAPCDKHGERPLRWGMAEEPEGHNRRHCKKQRLTRTVDLPVQKGRRERELVTS
jgi:hypothetical protein